MLDDFVLFSSNEKELTEHLRAHIPYIAAEENCVADALSKEFYQAQSTDSELKELLKSDIVLELHSVRIDKSPWAIYYGFSTGIPRSYIARALRQKIFELIHGLSHPSGKITYGQIRIRFV